MFVLGYAYRSEAVIDDGTPAPELADPIGDYVPTGRPGHRAPHLWVNTNGTERSTLDLFGRGLTLLRFSNEKDTLPAEAERRRIPFNAVRIDDPAIARLYERRLVLVRPDGHVAWRGDSAPEDPGVVLDRIRGEVQLEEASS